MVNCACPTCVSAGPCRHAQVVHVHVAHEAVPPLRLQHHLGGTHQQGYCRHPPGGALVARPHPQFVLLTCGQHHQHLDRGGGGRRLGIIEERTCISSTLTY